MTAESTKAIMQPSSGGLSHFHCPKRIAAADPLKI
jgi:hypothetical protein